MTYFVSVSHAEERVCSINFNEGEVGINSTD